MDNQNTTEAKIINITKDVEPMIKEATFDYTERGPKYGSTTRWTVRVDLYYLNGTTNNITMIIPVMQGGTEEAKKYLEGYVCELATLFLKVEYFKITLGSIDKDGKEHYSLAYRMKEVPIGKVWVNNYPFGMWMEPEKIIKGRREINSLNNSTRGPYPFPYNEPHEIVPPKIY
jgi:hypothetical protein